MLSSQPQSVGGRKNRVASASVPAGVVASGSTASEAATESVSFAFAKVCLADGASGARFCFDIAANKTF